MESSLTCWLPLSSIQSSFFVGDKKFLRIRSCVPTTTTTTTTRIACRKSFHARASQSTGADDDGDGHATMSQSKRRELLAAGVAGSAAQLFLGHGGGSTAFGAPTTPPNLANCVPAVIRGDNTTKCCLPKSALPAKPYVPRPGPKPRVRRRANAVDKEYVTKYNEAYKLMRGLPDDDPRNFMQQANVHCAFCNGAYFSAQAPDKPFQVHFSYLFFPWHRYYLYFHERILAKLIGDPTFALPYWNWDDQTFGGNVLPEIFNQKDKYPELYDINRDVRTLPPTLAPLGGVNDAPNKTNEEIVKDNYGVMYNSLIKPTAQELFLGQAPLLDSNLMNDDAGGLLELGPHTAIHMWVGNTRNEFNEDMGNFFSAARDPVFYSHHANVDRCWYIWDTLPDRRKELYSDTDFLQSSFVFYDENAELVQVKVKDCLDLEKNLGIKFEPSPGSEFYRTEYAEPLGKVKGVVPKGKAGLPKGVSKSKGQAVQKLAASKTLTAVVNRPTGEKAAFARAKGITESQVEEVLVLEDVVVPTTTNTYLAVFINLPDANTSTTLNCAEYVGSYASLPHMGMGMGHSANIRFSITTNIANLGIEDQDTLVVTVVSKVVDAKESQVTVGGFKIQYV